MQVVEVVVVEELLVRAVLVAAVKVLPLPERELCLEQPIQAAVVALLMERQ